MSTVNSQDLDFWVENNLNVLFIGEKGVGKSAIVQDTFERHNLKWKYFSASTMDPWVDLVGIPREVKDESGESYLELIRLKELQFDQVEAIMMDELNRAHKKVINAVMELIQFKSINGKKFPNLRMVWAAINPAEAEGSYHVEELDPAQVDRFHVHVNMDYAPDPKYFKKKFGFLSDGAIRWWNDLPAEMRKQVSPRRLDYAIEIFQKGGDIRFVLPKSTNVGKFKDDLFSAGILNELKEAQKDNNLKYVEDIFKDDNNFQHISNLFVKGSKQREDFVNFCMMGMSPEQISVLVSRKEELITNLVNAKYDKFNKVIKNILDAKTNTTLVNRILKIAQKNADVAKQYGIDIKKNSQQFYNEIDEFTDKLVNSKTTIERDKVFEEMDKYWNENHEVLLNSYDNLKKFEKALDTLRERSHYYTNEKRRTSFPDIDAKVKEAVKIFERTMVTTKQTDDNSEHLPF